MKPVHPLHATHELVQHTDVLHTNWELIPRLEVILNLLVWTYLYLMKTVRILKGL